MSTHRGGVLLENREKVNGGGYEIGLNFLAEILP